jgi:hypothetical protein
MNVLKNYFGSILAGRQKMEAVCPDWNLGTVPTSQIMQSCNLKTIILNINIHIPCILSTVFVATNLVHVLGNIYTLLFYSVFWSQQKYVQENIV